VLQFWDERHYITSVGLTDYGDKRLSE